MKTPNLDCLYPIRINDFDFFYGWDDSYEPIEGMHIAFDNKQISKSGWKEALDLLFAHENEIRVLYEFSHLEWWIPDDAEWTLCHGGHEKPEKEGVEHLSMEQVKDEYGNEIAKNHPRKDEITKMAKLVLNSSFEGFEEAKIRASDWMQALSS